MSHNRPKLVPSQSVDIHDLYKLMNETQSLIKQNTLNDGEYSHAQVRQSISEMTESLNDLTKKLVDPEEGLIVKVNQNAESHKLLAETLKDYPVLREEVNTFTRWRKTTTKVFWLVVTAGIAYFSEIFKK